MFQVKVKEKKTETRITIAKILKPHGIKGAVKVKSFSEDLTTISKCHFEIVNDKCDDEFAHTLHIDVVKPLGEYLIVGFKEITSIEVAEKYRGILLTVERSSIIQQDSFSVDDVLVNDLIGFTVVDEQDKNIGKIEGYYGGGNNGLYLVERQQETAMPINVDTRKKKYAKNLDFYLPCERSFFKKIDLSSQKIVICAENFFI